MRTATILAMALLATPAMAEFDAFAQPMRSDYIMPTMRDGYGMPAPVPKIGVDGGQANPEYRVAERGAWDNNTAPGTSYGSPGDIRGSNVSISLPDGPGNIREALQGMIQDFARAIGSGTEPRASSCICSGVGNYDSRSGGTGTSYK